MMMMTWGMMISCDREQKPLMDIGFELRMYLSTYYLPVLHQR